MVPLFFMIALIVFMLANESHVLLLKILWPQILKVSKLRNPKGSLNFFFKSVDKKEREKEAERNSRDMTELENDLV